MKNIETNGLPTSWSWTTLDNIIIALESGNRPKGGVRGIDKGIPSLGGEHLEYGGGFKFDRIKYVPPAFYEQMSKGKIRINDILVVKDGATTGKAAHISNSFPFKDAAVNEHVFILRIDKELMSSKYLFYWIQSLMGQECIRQNISGSAQGGINSHFVKNSNLPLAPTNEQHRIVAKIEELFTKLDAGVEALKQVHAQLKRYRQSVLKAAVEGRPTAEWRQQRSDQASKDELEHADKLLERILKERREKWEAEQLAKYKSNGKKPKDWQDKYKEPTPPDTTNLPELPTSWKWTSIDQISYEIRYGSSSRTNTDKIGIPVLRMGNIIDGNLVFNKLKFLPENHYEFPDLFLVSGDLLFNRTNSPELVGKTAIYEGHPSPCSFASYLIRVRFCEGIDPHFISFFINSAYGHAWIRSVVSQQVGQANVNGTKLKNLAIPFPSFSEQREIVLEVEKILSIIDESKLEIESELNRAHSLRQSILKRAFEGKLVPQDPNYLPAPQPGKYYVYVLECSNGSYYIGQTENIEKRWCAHTGGKGADWTRKYPPVALVHWEEYNSRDNAAKSEKELKTGFGRKWIKREVKAGRLRQAGEPASVLLERIKSEKAKYKKPKQMEKS